MTLHLPINSISLVKRFKWNNFNGKFGWWAECLGVCIAGKTSAQQKACDDYRTYWAKEPLLQRIKELEKHNEKIEKELEFMKEQYG